MVPIIEVPRPRAGPERRGSLSALLRDAPCVFDYVLHRTPRDALCPSVAVRPSPCRVVALVASGANHDP